MDHGILTIDAALQSQIPEKWRAATLSKLEPPSDQVRSLLSIAFYS
jgi:hypothetical protein